VKYQFVLFDLDGTLCDPGPSITGTVAFTLKEMGAPALSETRLRSFVGPPLVRNFESVFGDGDPLVDEAVAIFRKRFWAEGIPMYQAYPGVVELLTGLRESGIELAVATSKPEPMAKRILDEQDMTKFFRVLAGPLLDVVHTKAETVREALEALGMPKSVVMVGDREHDVYGAQANGVASIGVLYGYGDRAELEAAGASEIAESVEDLGKLLR
jgi:phosphoglycolate phosphatase